MPSKKSSYFENNTSYGYYLLLQASQAVRPTIHRTEMKRNREGFTVFYQLCSQDLQYSWSLYFFAMYYSSTTLCGKQRQKGPPSGLGVVKRSKTSRCNQRQESLVMANFLLPMYDTSFFPIFQAHPYADDPMQDFHLSSLKR